MVTFSVDAKDAGKGEREKMRRLADLVRFLSRELRCLDLGCEPFPLRYFEEKECRGLVNMFSRCLV